MFKFLFKPLAFFEELLNNPDRYVSIKNRFYKKLLKRLSNVICVDEHYDDNLEVYKLLDTSTWIIHITNDELGRNIYTSLQNNFKLTSGLNNLKFVTLSKENKVVFVVCDCNPHTSSERLTNTDIISDLLSYIDNFEEFLSTKNLHVDLVSLCDQLIVENRNFIISLFLSLTFDEVSNSPDCFKQIINCLLTYYRHYNRITLNQVYHYLEDTKSNFYGWLNDGVYIGKFASQLNSIPLGLYANILKYALNPNRFSNVRELFEYNSVFKDLSYDKDNLIIDEERFYKSLSYQDENKDFITYTYNNQFTFIKLKDTNYTEALENTVKLLENVLDYTSIIYSESGDIWLISEKVARFTKLREYIKYIANNEYNFLKLILEIYHKFSNNTYLNTVYFQSSANPLDYLYFDAINNQLNFFELSHLSISNPIPSEAFNCPFVIRECIREYMLCSSICIDNIYNCEFTKIFPPAFTSWFIESLKPNASNPKGSSKILKGTLSLSYASKIIFAENIPLNDSNLISRLSFFEGATLSEELQNTVDKQRNLDASKGFLLLDNQLVKITSSKLTQKNLDSIFTNEIESSRFVLKPEKVIISRETNKDGNYKIIGIVWNYNSLENALDYIKNGNLNTKQIYKFVAHLLSLYKADGIPINKIKNLSDILLICTTNNEPVLNIVTLSRFISHYRVNLSNRSLVYYYDDLVAYLKKLGFFENVVDDFDFSHFVPNCRFQGMNQQYVSMLNAIDAMQLCKSHNRWHLKDDMCWSCKKVHEIVDDLTLNTPLYKDEVSTFYAFEDSYCLCKPFSRSSRYVNQIKIGIEHDLFSNFVFYPSKVVVKSQDLNVNKQKVYGIKFNKNIDFSKVIDMSSFKHLQRLKAILVLYKELLPYILDKSFISIDTRIFDTIIMHKDLKGKVLIPNLMLMDCEMVISKNNELKESKAEKTKQVFSNFLVCYIMADEFLASKIVANESEFVEIINDIEQGLFTEDVIRNCLNRYDGFCLTHMVPFPAENTLCDYCKKDGILTSRIIVKDKAYFEQLERNAPEFDGGEANLYPYSTDEVQKIFNSTVNLKFKSQILAKAIQKDKLIHKFNEENDDVQIISVNNILYMLDNNMLKLKGFTQQFIEGSFKISCLKDKAFVEEHGYECKDIVEILMRVCKGIAFLHSIGGFIGDLNGGNILIKNKVVYIIDIDGMSFDEVRNSVYTNLYIYPPSAENNNITAEDDWYSLAIQAFYYLTHSHPFKGICNNSSVPDNETERMKQKTSILGNHGITPPSISIGWDFIPKYLLDYFLDTFEDSKRESMLELLQKFHSTLSKNSLKLTEIKRQSSVSINLSEYTYLNEEFDLMYNEKLLLNVSGPKTFFLGPSIKKTLISTTAASYLLDEVSGKVTKLDKEYSNVPLDISKDKIYYTSDDGKTLFVDNIINNDVGDLQQIKTRIIQKVTTDAIIALSVVEDDRFVFVEDNSNSDSYDIYCNAIKLHSVSKDSFSSKADTSISYDKLSKKWLVVLSTNELSIGIVISRESQNVSTFELQEVLSKSKCFYGNTLYYACEGKIRHYNVNTGKLKSMPCKVINPESTIYRDGNKFVIINSDSAYMYSKT